MLLILIVLVGFIGVALGVLATIVWLKYIGRGV